MLLLGAGARADASTTTVAAKVDSSLARCMIYAMMMLCSDAGSGGPAPAPSLWCARAIFRLTTRNHNYR